jgi:hypothetical protein
MNQIVLTSEQFGVFLRTMSIFKDVCNDIDIREGFVRQRTNDKFSVFQIDFNTIIPNFNIPITDLKQKLDLFKIFSYSDVTITVEDTYYTISDQHSIIRFENPDLDFIDNKFISLEELQNVFLTNEEDIILSTDISESISQRMKVITGVFNVNSMKVIFNGETANISTRTQSKDQYAELLSNIVTERVLNCNTDIVSTPFTIDHDGVIQLKMYGIINDDSSISCNVFKTCIGNIDINIYTRSTLLEEESVE